MEMKTNTNETNAHSTLAVSIDWQYIENVEKFANLGDVVPAYGGIELPPTSHNGLKTPSPLSPLG